MWKKRAAKILEQLPGNKATELLIRELRSLTPENIYPWLRDLVIAYKNGLISDEGFHAGGPSGTLPRARDHWGAWTRGTLPGQKGRWENEEGFR